MDVVPMRQTRFTLPGSYYILSSLLYNNFSALIETLIIVLNVNDTAINIKN